MHAGHWLVGRGGGGWRHGRGGGQRVGQGLTLNGGLVGYGGGVERQASRDTGGGGGEAGPRE